MEVQSPIADLEVAVHALIFTEMVEKNFRIHLY